MGSVSKYKETTLNRSTQEILKVLMTMMLRVPPGRSPRGWEGINAQAHASHTQESTHMHARTHTHQTRWTDTHRIWLLFWPSHIYC